MVLPSDHFVVRLGGAFGRIPSGLPSLMTPLFYLTVFLAGVDCVAQDVLGNLCSLVLLSFSLLGPIMSWKKSVG